MKIWFDTEFYENGRTIELISIGAVRADGVEYYAETAAAYGLCAQSDWLKANVLPHLTGKPGLWPTEIAKELLAFAGPAPEWWAYYADYDWVALCQLYGRMIDLPKGWPMFCRDLIQDAKRSGLQLPKQTSAVHNALADAKWCRDAHLWLGQQELLARRASNR